MDFRDRRCSYRTFFAYLLSLPHIRDPSGGYAAIRSTSLVFCLVTRHLLPDSSSLFSNSCGLFCSRAKPNSFVFKRFRTLSQKHPGWGEAHDCTSHSETPSGASRPLVTRRISRSKIARSLDGSDELCDGRGFCPGIPRSMGKRRRALSLSAVSSAGSGARSMPGCARKLSALGKPARWNGRLRVLLAAKTGGRTGRGGGSEFEPAQRGAPPVGGSTRSLHRPDPFYDRPAPYQHEEQIIVDTAARLFDNLPQ